MRFAAEKPLLSTADIAEPLQSVDLVDAGAILYDAGHEATPQDMTAFAYYHRKQLAELVEHPGVDASYMLSQLFDSLPEQLDQQSLLLRLRTEVDGLHEQLLTTRQTEHAPVVQSVTVPTRVRPTPHTRNLVASTDRLFSTEFAAFNAEPSDDLVKKAKGLDSYHELGKFVGPLVWLYSKQKNRFNKLLLLPAAVVNGIVATPIIVTLEGTIGRKRTKAFQNQLIKEYPHLNPARVSVLHPDAYKPVRSGTTESYLKEVLTFAEQEAVQSSYHDSGLPPGAMPNSAAKSHQPHESLNQHNGLLPLAVNL